MEFLFDDSSFGDIKVEIMEEPDFNVSDGISCKKEEETEEDLIETQRDTVQRDLKDFVAKFGCWELTTLFEDDWRLTYKKQESFLSPLWKCNDNQTYSFYQPIESSLGVSLLHRSQEFQYRLKETHKFHFKSTSQWSQMTQTKDLIPSIRKILDSWEEQFSLVKAFVQELSEFLVRRKVKVFVQRGTNLVLILVVGQVPVRCQIMCELNQRPKLVVKLQNGKKAFYIKPNLFKTSVLTTFKYLECYLSGGQEVGKYMTFSRMPGHCDHSSTKLKVPRKQKTESQKELQPSTSGVTDTERPMIISIKPKVFLKPAEILPYSKEYVVQDPPDWEDIVQSRRNYIQKNLMNFIQNTSSWDLQPVSEKNVWTLKPRSGQEQLVPLSPISSLLKTSSEQFLCRLPMDSSLTITLLENSSYLECQMEETHQFVCPVEFPANASHWTQNVNSLLVMDRVSLILVSWKKQLALIQSFLEALGKFLKAAGLNVALEGYDTLLPKLSLQMKDVNLSCQLMPSHWERPLILVWVNAKPKSGHPIRDSASIATILTILKNSVKTSPTGPEDNILGDLTLILKTKVMERVPMNKLDLLHTVQSMKDKGCDISVECLSQMDILRAVNNDITLTVSFINEKERVQWSIKLESKGRLVAKTQWKSSFPGIFYSNFPFCLQKFFPDFQQTQSFNELLGQTNSAQSVFCFGDVKQEHSYTSHH